MTYFSIPSSANLLTASGQHSLHVFACAGRLVLAALVNLTRRNDNKRRTPEKPIDARQQPGGQPGSRVALEDSMLDTGASLPETILAQARQTGARVRLIEDASLLAATFVAAPLPPSSVP